MAINVTLESDFIDEIVEKLFEKIKPLLKSNKKDEADTIIFDVNDLSKYLNVSKKWIYERTHLAEIPYLKINGLLRFKKNDIDKWINTFNVPAVGTAKTHLKVIK